MRVRQALHGFPLPACGERVRVRGSNRGKPLYERLGKLGPLILGDAGRTPAAQRGEPAAAPHPDPLPVALGRLVASSRLWMARGRRGEGDGAGRPSC